jgi:RNA polymerase sigma-70 factor (sigma-E family)
MMTAVGDRALADLYAAQYPRLVGLARLLLDERGLAEEVVQEAFARTYAAWPRIRRTDDPLPYVRRAVVNLARGGLRHRRVVRGAPAARAEDVPSPEQDALVDERRREVADAVRALPRRQRECVVLRYFLDCSTAETADALGVSEGTVKQHLHRALGSLAVTLAEDAEENV